MDISIVILYNIVHIATVSIARTWCCHFISLNTVFCSVWHATFNCFLTYFSYFLIFIKFLPCSYKFVLISGVPHAGSVAVSTIRHQSVQSPAFLQAEWIPMLTDCTPVLIPSAGCFEGSQSNASMTRWWYCLETGVSVSVCVCVCSKLQSQKWRK